MSSQKFSGGHIPWGRGRWGALVPLPPLYETLHLQVIYFTGHQLYILIADLIPKLKSRQPGSGGGAEGRGAAGTSKKKKKKK